MAITISITGASGFIGRRLSAHLVECGYRVVAIPRETLQSEQLHEIIAESDIVINLAGESINQRWSRKAKRRILESRTFTTRAIVSAINRTRDSKLLISASAVGIYPSRGCHNDYSRRRGGGFLASVCRAWEGEAQRLDPRHSLTITRFGVVFGADGGALPKLTATARFGFMVRFGAPHKLIAWVGIEDLIAAIAYIIECDELRGVVNICAPEQTTQQQLMDALSPVTIPLPEVTLRILYGEAAEMVLANCCATPHRLLISGFKFQSPTIGSYFTNRPI